MSKQRKKGQKKGGENKTLETIVFATAVLNLVEALIEIIRKLIE